MPHIPPRSGDEITVALWSNAVTTYASGNPASPQLWGQPTNGNEHIFAPSDEGMVIFDDAGHQVGEIIESTVYCHYAPQNFYSEAAGEHVFRQFLAAAKAILLATPDERTMHHQRQAEERKRRELDCTRAAYVQECAGRYQRNLDELRRAVGVHETRNRDLQRQLVETIRQGTDARRQLDRLLQDEGTEREKYGREFDSLLNVPKVTKVDVHDGVVRIYTEVLYCTDPRSNKRHEIGAFRIELYRAGYIFWINLTRKVNAYRPEMNAPHVYADGHACLGNATDMFPQLLADYEYAAAAMLAIQFIESVNVDDSAGCYVTAWPCVN